MIHRASERCADELRSAAEVGVPQMLDSLLAEALRRRASDVHLEPTAAGCEVRLRVDGLLEAVQRHDCRTGRSLVSRLMVLARLLTYRVDIPQEGRMTVEVAGSSRALDLRVAIMPTIHGLRAVVRLPAELIQPRTLVDLGLPRHVLAGLQSFAASDAGMLLVVGPAGSGKTTTIYALLEHIADRHGGQSLISLEDPVERQLRGVTQIEVKPFGELGYLRALRSMLRQDPQVLMLGEIRDRETASLAVQAALSGHRLICTLHAGSPAEAIARLLELGLEPCQLTGTLFGVVALRLLRRADGHGGYQGRAPVAEWVRLDEPLRQAILRRQDAVGVARCLREQAGHATLADSAADAVSRGLTDVAEVRRVFGWAGEGSCDPPGASMTGPGSGGAEAAPRS